MGGIDVLVNNAACDYRAEIGALAVERMKTMFATNVSTSGMKGVAAATPYAASKWAVRGVSQCWQAELRPHGIRVISICPSEVQTSFGGKTGRDNPNKLYAIDIAETIVASLDMPRRVLWPELAVFASNPWKED